MNKGRPPKKLKHVRFTISMDPMIAEKLEELCELTQFARSEMIAIAVLHFWRDCMDATNE